MEIKKRKTKRGFDLIEFEDLYGAKCNIQKSSLATEDAIWFGAENIDAKYFVPHEGWKELKPPLDTYDMVANNRMHLSRKQVRELLPILEAFVKTGEVICNEGTK